MNNYELLKKLHEELRYTIDEYDPDKDEDAEIDRSLNIFFKIKELKDRINSVRWSINFVNNDLQKMKEYEKQLKNELESLEKTRFG